LNVEVDLETVELSRQFVETFNPAQDTALLLGVSPAPLNTPTDYLSDLLELGSAGFGWLPQAPVLGPFQPLCFYHQLTPEELRSRLQTKLEEKLVRLQSAQETVASETESNERKCCQLKKRLQQTATKSQVDKYDSVVSETGTVCLLLVSLATRLARTHNIANIQTTQDEITSLRRKEEKLAEQLTEAASLKENVNKRFACMTDLLRELVGEEDAHVHANYIRSRQQLILHQRLLADNIKTTNSQITAVQQL